MATITNTTKTPIGVTPDHIIAGGAEASVPDDVLKQAMNHPGVKALFGDGSLTSDSPVKQEQEPDGSAAEKAALAEDLKSLGITADGRWSLARLKEEHAKALDAATNPQT